MSLYLLYAYAIQGRMCFGLWQKDEAQKQKFEKFEGCLLLCVKLIDVCFRRPILVHCFKTL